MAVRVFCDNPDALLRKIKAAIRSGTIESWELDSDGDLTRTQEQHRHRGWFHPSDEDDKLVFYFYGQRSVATSKLIYGVYHGRLIEMLLTRFDSDFTRATATALPIAGDRLYSES